MSVANENKNSMKGNHHDLLPLGMGKYTALTRRHWSSFWLYCNVNPVLAHLISKSGQRSS